MPLNRADLKVRYEMFDQFALDDQRNYYKATLGKYRLAASQVNRLRAALAFLTGFASAAAALIVQSKAQSGFLLGLTSIFAILAIILPAFGALFSTLADLYQWDRLITIYDAALENIEVADAQSPDDSISDDVTYRAALTAYTEGTLSVMSDESSQWGQAIRTPAQLEKYLADAKKRAEEVSKISDSDNSSSTSTPGSGGVG